MSTEMDLRLNLEAPSWIGADLLETHTFQVLEAVEQHGPKAALGPAVSANFASNVIELAFTVCVPSLSEAQAIAAAVIETIEKHTDVQLTAAGTCASGQGSERQHDLMLVS